MVYLVLFLTIHPFSIICSFWSILQYIYVELVYLQIYLHIFLEIYYSQLCTDLLGYLFEFVSLLELFFELEIEIIDGFCQVRALSYHWVDDIRRFADLWTDFWFACYLWLPDWHTNTWENVLIPGIWASISFQYRHILWSWLFNIILVIEIQIIFNITKYIFKLFQLMYITWQYLYLQWIKHQLNLWCKSKYFHISFFIFVISNDW